MIVYFSGVEGEGDYQLLGDLPGIAYLVSYYYLKDKGLKSVEYANSHNIPVFLDSGAFSAMMCGAKIDIYRFIDFCKENRDKFSVISCLDVIGDWHGTLKNYEIMINTGVDCIPCFHVNEPFEALRDLLRGCNYVALGVAGLQRRRDSIMAWITKCYRLRQEINPECKYHGFALTSPRVMYSFPWYSVDSTNWLVGRRFGQFIIREGREFKIFNRSDTRQVKKYWRIVKDIWIPRNGTKKDYEKLLRFNAMQMLEWARIYK